MSKRGEFLYLTDILDSVVAIESYVGNVDYDQFIADRKTYSATIRELQIIGEAIKKLDAATLKEHPEVQWQDIKDFRNLLIH